MFRWLLRVGFAMDALRVWPRVFVSIYLAGLTQILAWYLKQDAPTWDRSGFVAAYGAFCLPLLKWYMDNGVDWERFMGLFDRHCSKPKEPTP